MNVAQYLAKVLSEKGVRYVFGIPGGPSLPYMEAMRQEGIRFILTSHESSAGIMADVTARLTGIPGVCHATFGPGATNLSTGVGGALLDRSPVIALTTEVPDRMLGRTTQMGIDHQGLYKPVTKATYRLTEKNIASVLEESFTIAASELPGPVHIGLPSDISSREVQTVNPVARKAMFQESGNDHQRVMSLLRAAKRPVMAVGLTAARLGAGTALAAFLKERPMPVVLTPMAKGVLPQSHQCYAGVLFHALSDRLRSVAQKADLVIGLGYDPVEYNYESWIPAAPVVHLGTGPVDMPEGIEYGSVTGSVEEWFSILNSSVRSDDYLTGSGTEEARKEIGDVFSRLALNWGPVSALKTLREALPGESILTCDVGSHLHMAGQYWPVESASDFIITNGWSTMGFGIPSALAASLNCPDKPVIALVGDGGFLMSAGEIMTARRYNINIKVVVLADRELNLIKLKQSWKGTDPYATTLLEGDMFGSGVFLGVPVLNASDSGSMQKAVRKALSMAGPVIINATVPGDDYKELVVRQ